MDHDIERRKETEDWQMLQVSPFIPSFRFVTRDLQDNFQYLHKELGLADIYSEDEINRAVGILRTNDVQIKHPYLLAQGTSGKGLYPTFALLSHSCIANAR